jgi:hypothetical protein
MPRRLHELLTQQATEQFVGRTAELAFLLQVLEQATPLVVHVYGIGGIGKSSLLAAFAEQARSQRVITVQLDCHAIEPSPEGFLQALTLAMGGEATTPQAAAERLSGLGQRVILTIDAYELFRLMDSWLRQTFVPYLHENVRLFLFGREPPAAAWSISPGWPGLFHAMRLEPLNQQSAIDLLRQLGVPPDDVARINRVIRGHPLALKLAATTLREQPTSSLEEIATQHLVADLTQLYLRDIHDPLTQQGLEAAAVVRRVTLPLLSALLPGTAPQDVFARLQALPFVTLSSDGLLLHESVQQAIAAHLRAVNPRQYLTLRRAAWHDLRAAIRTATQADVWRYCADLLYLIEQPIVREAFFPSNVQPYTVERAHEADSEAILTITRQHEGAEAACLLEQWWRTVPQAFLAVRDQTNTLIGYYMMVESDSVDPALVRSDPLMNRWWQHLQESPMPKGQQALFCRRWLDLVQGEDFSPTQAACWLEIKASYVALRRTLRRLYCTAVNRDVYGPTLSQLRFRLLPECAVELDGVQYHTAMLDFGPELFNGWLTSLVGRELGVVQPEDILDVEARQLILDGHRIALTPTEFAVLHYLVQREGKVVTRDALIADVWRYRYDGGSNFVDARIRTLRKKMGHHASLIETVPGVGYRFRRG